MTRQIFNEILKQEDCTPSTWRKMRIKVMHKKGSLEEAGNYRPMCTLPALYKLFATLLCNRLYPRLDRVQSEDQGGFRRGSVLTDRESDVFEVKKGTKEGDPLWSLLL